MSRNQEPAATVAELDDEKSNEVTNVCCMNVISYKYRDIRFTMPQFLYVDADYDKALFPSNVREIIEKSGHSNPIGIDVIQRMGKDATERFVSQHYLDGCADMIEHS